MKVLDMCMCDENKMVYRKSVDEMFGGDWGEYGDWKGYYRALREGNCEELWFNFDEIDRRYFILDDGGEGIVLKDGRIVCICWRGGLCNIWEEDDEEQIEWIKERLEIA